MTFQSSVFFQTGSGVPGEVFTNYPKRAQSLTINSALASYNIIGATAYTILSPGFAQAGNGSGNFGFAGFLFNPKVYALQGNGSNTLAPSLVLPNFTQGEFITEGSLWVTLPNTANIGDIVIYDNTTGAISSISPTTALPSGKTFANAQVDYFDVTTAGLAVISITPLIVGTAV
jgi:hypothetical protein